MDTTTNPNMIDAVAAAIRWHGTPGARFAIVGEHTITENADGAFGVYEQIDGDEVCIATTTSLADAISLTR